MMKNTWVVAAHAASLLGLCLAADAQQVALSTQAVNAMATSQSGAMAPPWKELHPAPFSGAKAEPKAASEPEDEEAAPVPKPARRTKPVRAARRPVVVPQEDEEEPEFVLEAVPQKPRLRPMAPLYNLSQPQIVVVQQNPYGLPYANPYAGPFGNTHMQALGQGCTPGFDCGQQPPVVYLDPSAFQELLRRQSGPRYYSNEPPEYHRHHRRQAKRQK
ncbi:MAG: hypothetical protein HY078_01315 [Elusimicrobia bacterium]|nr:hypothetical protein [Elusimicrobiota bacterium]